MRLEGLIAQLHAAEASGIEARGVESVRASFFSMGSCGTFTPGRPVRQI